MTEVCSELADLPKANKASADHATDFETPIYTTSPARIPATMHRCPPANHYGERRFPKLRYRKQAQPMLSRGPIAAIPFLDADGRVESRKGIGKGISNYLLRAALTVSRTSSSDGGKDNERHGSL